MSTLEVKELSHPTGEVLKIAAGKTLDLKSQGTTTLPTGSVLQVVQVTGSTGSTGLDDKQTIVFGFIMVITFIVLGVVSITTIIKKKKDKERVEITNWPI